MKSPPSLTLLNPVPVPILSGCCPKRKGSFPKIWSLHPLKMVLSTRSRVTAPPWIPGKGSATIRPLGTCLSFPLSVLGACLPCHHLLIPSPITGGGEEGRSLWGLLLNLALASPTAGLPGSEFQVQAPARGTLGRVYPGNRGSEKHSPDSACSVDYSSSRLSSPEHPNEGEAAALREAQAGQWAEVGMEALGADGYSIWCFCPLLHF